jgi:hypothetical protein
MKHTFAAAAAIMLAAGLAGAAPGSAVPTGDWLARWEKNITDGMRNRYCDRETGEELGWLVSPFLDGFYYGYLGWPKVAGASTSAVQDFYTDNQLGEAMLLRPLVLMAADIAGKPALQKRYGPKAQAYLQLSEQTFRKWDSRGAWRTVKDGGLWVVPPFGFDQATGRWPEGYAQRQTGGFSLPANKQNLVAAWLLAMFDATGKPVYRDRA